MVSTKTSLKSLLTLGLFTMLAMLAGCGGGGAKTPSCADTNSCPVSAPPLIVNPTTLNVYPGVPVVLTISSGVGPFQVFSSDSVVLPVTQVVSGAAITLTANAIDGADRAVSLTIRDAAGQTVSINAIVKPSPLLGTLTVTPAAGSACAGAGSGGGGNATASIAICSGETASATITVRGSNSQPIQNRQIKFDVVQGPFNFVLDQASSLLAKTQTVTTDQNGQAVVTLRSDSGVPSQVVVIRATDVASGNRVDRSFTVIQATSGTPAYSVSPASASIAGYYVNSCGLGSTSYVIYGGTAPYNVIINNIAFAVLEYGSTRGQSVVVPASGAAFNVVSLGGACAGTSTAVITITDASGRVITASFQSVAGTVALPTPPAPNDLIVTPPDARIVCSNQSVVIFSVSGGTGPYTIATDRPYVPPVVPEATPSNGTTVLSGSSIRLNQTFPVGEVINVAISDAKSDTVAARITCVAP